MAKTVPTTVILRGAERCMQVEHTMSGSAITPGHLVALASDGTVANHGAANGLHPERMFAIEDDAQGRGIDDNYTVSANPTVRCMICPPGTEVYAMLGSSENIAIGDKLASDGVGHLQESTTAGAVIAVALEAKTTGSPIVTETRIRVRVI